MFVSNFSIIVAFHIIISCLNPELADLPLHLSNAVLSKDDFFPQYVNFYLQVIVFANSDLQLYILVVQLMVETAYSDLFPVFYGGIGYLGLDLAFNFIKFL
jgi:hypothetical protein